MQLTINQSANIFNIFCTLTHNKKPDKNVGVFLAFSVRKRSETFDETMALPEILLMSDVLYQKCMKQLTLSSANTQILYIKYQGSFQQQYL